MVYLKFPLLTIPGKSIQKGRSALSIVKHSAKNLLSFRSLMSEESSKPTSDSSDVEDMPSSNLEQPHSLKEKTNPSISNVSAQYGSSNSVKDVTQENINEDSVVPLPGRTVTQQQSSSSQVPMERSGDVFPSTGQQANSSMRGQTSHEYASNITGGTQPRSYSMPGQMSREKSKNVGNTSAQQRRHSLPGQIKSDR